MKDGAKKVVIALLGVLALLGTFACTLSQPDETSSRQVANYGISGPTSIVVGDTYDYAVSGPPGSQVYVRWYLDGKGVGGGVYNLNAEGKEVATWTFTEHGQYTINLYREGTQGDPVQASLKGIFTNSSDSTPSSISRTGRTSSTPNTLNVHLYFTSISSGVDHVCGLTNLGTILCWGRNDGGQATAPEGPFKSISGGEGYTCGVRDNGSAVCWGFDRDDLGGRATPPRGTYSSVIAGPGYHTCAMTSEGSVDCWGYDDDGQASPPAESFVSVSVGGHHTCGVKATDSSVACWGHNGSGRAAAPDGAFSSVSAHNWYTCGVRADGVAVCWGSDADSPGREGRASPPAGSFISISTGSEHACGVIEGGAVACWGFNASGQASPPDGNFVSVSAGGYHTCGLKPDGTVECWGSNSFGEAEPPRLEGTQNPDERAASVQSTVPTWTPEPTWTPQPTPTPTPLPTSTPTLPELAVQNAPQCVSEYDSEQSTPDLKRHEGEQPLEVITLEDGSAFIKAGFWGRTISRYVYWHYQPGPVYGSFGCKVVDYDAYPTPPPAPSGEQRIRQVASLAEEACLSWAGTGFLWIEEVRPTSEDIALVRMRHETPGRSYSTRNGMGFTDWKRQPDRFLAYSTNDNACTENEYARRAWQEWPEVLPTPGQ